MPLRGGEGEGLAACAHRTKALRVSHGDSSLSLTMSRHFLIFVLDFSG